MDLCFSWWTSFHLCWTVYLKQANGLVIVLQEWTDSLLLSHSPVEWRAEYRTPICEKTVRLFKWCPKCGSKLSASDGHSLCLLCHPRKKHHPLEPDWGTTIPSLPLLHSAIHWLISLIPKQPPGQLLEFSELDKDDFDLSQKTRVPPQALSLHGRESGVQIFLKNQTISLDLALKLHPGAILAHIWMGRKDAHPIWPPPPPLHLHPYHAP